MNRRIVRLSALFALVGALALVNAKNTIIAGNSATSFRPDFSGTLTSLQPNPLTLAPVPLAPTADYRFQNTRSSSVAGAPDLTDLIAPGQTCPSYCNTFASDVVNGFSQTVLQFPFDNGVSLSPTTSPVLTNNGIYTIVVQFKFSNVGNNFDRILDFKNGTSDRGLYNINGKLQFFDYLAGPDALISANTYVQVVLTRDGAGTLTGYVNGVQEFSVDDSANQLGVIDSNNNLRFFQDNTSSGFEWFH